MSRHPLPTRTLLLGFATVLLTVGGGRVAGAHTEVQRSTPGPGAEVAGVVDDVELVFLDPVREAEINVSVLDGEPVDDLGPTELDAERRVARVEFATLRQPGPVLVEYEWVAEDGAGQAGSFTFRYLGATTAVEDPPAVGTAGVLALIGFVVLAVAAGVLARFRTTRTD